MPYWDEHHIRRKETIPLKNNTSIKVSSLPHCFDMSSSYLEYFCKGIIKKKHMNPVCIGCGFRCTE